MEICSAKFCLIGIAFAIAIVKGTEAYTYWDAQKPGAEVCIDRDGVQHKPGDIWYEDEKCERLLCSGIEGYLAIIGEGCGRVDVPEVCQLVKASGRYPYCCPVPKC